MDGFMAIAYFLIFQSGFGIRLDPGMIEFWFMMQIAMLCGFVTSYPVNWWLIRRGIKEKMRRTGVAFETAYAAALSPRFISVRGESSLRARGETSAVEQPRSRH